MIENIGIIIHSLSTGGAEKVAALLSNYLVKQGKNVYLIVDSYDKRKTYKHSGKIVYMYNPSTGNPWIDIWYKAQDLKQKKKLYNIQCSISFIEDSNFVNVLSSNGERIIVSVHTYLSYRMNEWKKDKLRYRLLIPMLYNRANRVVALTQMGRKDLYKNFGVKKNKISVIPNPIDKECIKSRRKIELEEKAILMIGRLEYIKAYWYGIMAMRKVLDEDNTIHLYILGNGKLLKELQNMVMEYGIGNNVHFLGFCSNVGDYLQKARIFLLTSMVEGFSNVVVEALANGVPVIATDCVGPREILNPKQNGVEKIKDAVYGEYGILVPCLDKPNEMKIKILSNVILNVLNDNTLREHYIKKAKIRARDYEETLIFQKWEELINT